MARNSSIRITDGPRVSRIRIVGTTERKEDVNGILLVRDFRSVVKPRVGKRGRYPNLVLVGG